MKSLQSCDNLVSEKDCNTKEECEPSLVLLNKWNIDFGHCLPKHKVLDTVTVTNLYNSELLLQWSEGENVVSCVTHLWHVQFVLLWVPESIRIINWDVILKLVFYLNLYGKQRRKFFQKHRKTFTQVPFKSPLYHWTWGRELNETSSSGLKERLPHQM